MSRRSRRLLGLALAGLAASLTACDAPESPPPAESPPPTAQRWRTTQPATSPATMMALADPEPGQSAGASTPLTWAAGAGREDMVEQLLAEGTSVDQREPTGGRTPLHWAAFRGQEGTIRLLLARGAAIEARDGAYGRTALHWAAAGGQGGAVKLLLAKGANANATDLAGRKPVDLARDSANKAAFQALIVRPTE